MLDLDRWRKRIGKAWERAMKRKKSAEPNEITTRLQDGFHVSLILWDHKHEWWAAPVHDELPDTTKSLRVQVDRPLSQEEVFRWLGKTTPIE